jgi:hypothetical protein
MYSNKFAAKLMNIRRLCKENVRNLSIFMVLSTHYPTFRLEKGDEVYASTLLAVLSFYRDKICLDHLIATDLDAGQTAQLYASRQEIRQRLSQSLEEIASRLDQTKEQIETLRNDL